MAKLQCPNCGADVDTYDGWAKATLATLVPAPAVPGMVNQVRCKECQHFFNQPEVGSTSGWQAYWPMVALLAILVAAAVLLPG